MKPIKEMKKKLKEGLEPVPKPPLEDIYDIFGLSKYLNENIIK